MILDKSKQPPIDESIPCTCETKAAVCGRCIYCGHLKGDEMAKRKRAPRVIQTTIEGTQDEVPAEVREAADTYVTAKRSVAKFREKMNDSLADLIEKMKAADVHEILIDDGEKRLILTEKDQVKIKAQKKDKKADAA